MHLVFLHGPAAAGKLTTARALERRLGYPVFHNHLVVDTLTTVLPFGSEGFVRLREEFWLAVIGEAARTGRSLVFTFAPEATVAPGFPDRVRRAVEDHGGTVCFVGLLVGREEQERRLGSADRAAFHKLTDVQVLRRLRALGDEGVERPPCDLRISTDRSSPEQSAETIIEHFALEPEPPVVRYPEV